MTERPAYMPQDMQVNVLDNEARALLQVVVATGISSHFREDEEAQIY